MLSFDEKFANVDRYLKFLKVDSKGIFIIYMHIFEFLTNNCYTHHHGYSISLSIKQSQERFLLYYRQP